MPAADPRVADTRGPYRFGRVGFRISRRRRIVSEQPETISINLAHPAFKQAFPDGMLKEKAGDDADAHGVALTRRGTRFSRWIFSSKRPANHLPIEALQIPVVAPLI